MAVRLYLWCVGRIWEMYKEEGVEAIMASSSEFEEAWTVKGLDQLRPWDDRFWKLYDRGDVSVHKSTNHRVLRR